MMDYLPVFMDLRGRDVVLVGGGKVATRKAEGLVRAGARIHVIAPEVTQRLREFATNCDGSVRLQRFDGAFHCAPVLVFSATGDLDVDRAVRAAAQAAGVPLNVADTPALCDFILPAVVDRTPVVVAFSSGGAAPMLARRLRARLESDLPSNFGELARYLGSVRDRIRSAQPAESARLRIWESLLDSALPGRVLAGDRQAADGIVDRVLAGANARGEVYLVGAGPGDPDLLTLRALRLMQQADVVLHDRLVSDAVLELVRKDAERIYVGKRPRCHTVPQEELNALLVRLAREGRRVLRLKGGDPFVFGRGGEEIEELASAGIPFEVVPGITAANGCAAYAGIPLTHRDHAQAVRFVTGHLRDGTVDLDWAALANPRETLVFYMGLTGLPVICRELVAHGMDADTPIALVERGTLPEQRVLVSTLAAMPAMIAGADVHGPTLTIVGSVVRLRDRLDWFRAGVMSGSATSG